MPDTSEKNNKNSRATYELTQRVFYHHLHFLKLNFPSNLLFTNKGRILVS